MSFLYPPKSGFNHHIASLVLNDRSHGLIAAQLWCSTPQGGFLKPSCSWCIHGPHLCNCSVVGESLFSSASLLFREEVLAASSSSASSVLKSFPNSKVLVEHFCQTVWKGSNGKISKFRLMVFFPESECSRATIFSGKHLKSREEGLWKVQRLVMMSKNSLELMS